MNRKLKIIKYICSSNIKKLYDIIFISEISIGYGGLPSLLGYKPFSDNTILTRNCGGIAVYIKDNIAAHVFALSFNPCYISFRLDFCPSYIFIGTYIQPEGSRYFTPNMFADLAGVLLKCQENNLIPILGGDMNCRPGNLNDLQSTMSYSKNIDEKTNAHGRTYFPDICLVGKIFPLNHLIYRYKRFIGNFTYHKTDKHSQIDFVLTNQIGIRSIESFSIINENWHLSDHLPVTVSIKTNEAINAMGILRRARDLNYEFDPNSTIIKRYSNVYNYNIMEDYFVQNKLAIEHDVLRDIDNNNIQRAITTLDGYIENAHKCSKLTKQNTITIDQSSNLMDETNKAYQKYQKYLHDESVSTEDINVALQQYKICRKSLSHNVIVTETEKWNKFATCHDSKQLWKQIDWKGNVTGKPLKHPMLDDLANHYETLYSRDNQDEPLQISNLTTKVYLPVLDDPISYNDVEEAMKNMKKGGYDYKLPILNMLTTIFLPMILIIMNFMFYLHYPITLACSLLVALPKKGNLLLPKNYRGIQMLPALGALYDRILANRLYKWIGVESEQTAFQKGKSTLHQLFTLRLLIYIAQHMDITLYIGLFDIEKAFDRISRLLLLRKLVALGIGSCMLAALKLLYIPTFCVLSFYGQMSDRFETSTGIRQGASSSVFLFIVFINDLIIYLKVKCVEEPLINNMHSLLHADDTAILSTNRKLFIIKCNHMLQYFCDNQLGLNLGKSGYLIINAKNNDLKTTIHLDNGCLEYKNHVVYLGGFISDTGNIDTDVSLYLKEKRPNVSVKFVNFCAKNYLAPFGIKLKVLDTCVSSSLCYGSETWGQFKTPMLETLYRSGLKTALGIRSTTNNEITYIDSGQYPLECKIKKQQLNFWNTLLKDKSKTPNTPLSKLIDQAVNMKLKYIVYYQNLALTYSSPSDCQNKLQQQFKSKWSTKINNKTSEDNNSKLAAYLTVNPELTAPIYSKQFEIERITITRYRTGSHNLKIETGRMQNPKIPREERLCSCKSDVQTLEHCIMSCPLLNNTRNKHNFTSVANAFDKPNINQFLLDMEHILHV